MKLKEMYIPKPFNILSDEMMFKLNISHQRFFHHAKRQMPAANLAPFKAANVGLFTAYDDFKDVALQGLGIIAKPLIYVTAILAYTLAIAAVIIAALFMPVIVHYTKETYKDTAGFLGLVLLGSTTGIILSALSTVTEPVFSALGFFTRFFGSCVNPERHDIPAAKHDIPAAKHDIPAAKHDIPAAKIYDVEASSRQGTADAPRTRYETYSSLYGRKYDHVEELAQPTTATRDEARALRYGGRVK